MEQKFAPFKRQMLRSLTESYNAGVEEYFRQVDSITQFSTAEKKNKVKQSLEEISLLNKKIDSMRGEILADLKLEKYGE